MENDYEYSQFQNLKIPGDIKSLPIFETRKDLQKELKRSVDINKTLAISLNTKQFRQNEIHIHTADIGSSYEPDFDFSDLDEIDAWRKTCKLKFNLQRFTNVNYVRCDGFFHKMQVCESLTLMEEVHRMLVSGGCFIISVDNLYETAKKVTSINSADMYGLFIIEKQLFSAGDSTGLYYNRTIWTFERLSHYLKKANFSKIEKKSNDNEIALNVIAIKK